MSGEAPTFLKHLDKPYGEESSLTECAYVGYHISVVVYQLKKLIRILTELNIIEIVTLSELPPESERDDTCIGSVVSELSVRKTYELRHNLAIALRPSFLSIFAGSRTIPSSSSYNLM